MAIQVVQPGVPSVAQVVAKWGFTPADAGAVVMADGTSALPGMKFGTATTTGFYNYTAGTAASAIGMAVTGKRAATIDYRTLGSGVDNIRLSIGTGQAISDVTTETFIATIDVPSISISGAVPAAVMFNIGSIALTSSDTTTKTSQQALLELDKIDLYAGAGAVTFDDVLTLRIRTPVPRDDVTLTLAKGIELPYSQVIGTGTITNLYGINFISAGAGVTNYYGIFFSTEPNGGSIASAAGEDININAGISSSGNINLKTQGKLCAMIADVGATGNYLKLSANNQPLIQAVAGGATSGLGLSAGGGAAISFYSNSGASQQFSIAHVASTVNYVEVQGSATGNAPQIKAIGSDTNVNLIVTPKGTGVLRINNSGSFAANGSVATTMTSLGPAGSNTTVQEWMVIQNNSGTVRYIPLY